MNEIRKNNDKEETLLQLSFEMPKIAKIMWIIAICISTTPFISMVKQSIELSSLMGVTFFPSESVIFLIIPAILLCVFLRI